MYYEDRDEVMQIIREGSVYQITVAEPKSTQILISCKVNYDAEEMAKYLIARSNYQIKRIEIENEWEAELE